MKSPTSRLGSSIKNFVSLIMGAVLAAAVYANAVYVPENEDQLTSSLATQSQAIESGDMLLVPDQDGFLLTERIPQLAAQDAVKQAENIERLVAEIAELETALVVEEEEEAPAKPIVRTALKTQNVTRVAQNAFEQLANAARQISALSGLPQGATIGSLASIVADPLLAQGALEVIQVSNKPGGISAAISNGGGMSAQGTAVLALLGVQSVGGIGSSSSSSTSGGSVGRAASTNPSSSTVAPSSP